MGQIDETHRLGEALSHLHAFTATFGPGEYVDEESALTAEDLHVIVDMVEKIHATAKAPPKL